MDLIICVTVTLLLNAGMLLKWSLPYIALGLISYSAILPVSSIGIPLSLDDRDVLIPTGEIDGILNYPDLTNRDFDDFYFSVPPLDITDRQDMNITSDRIDEGTIFINI